MDFISPSDRDYSGQMPWQYYTLATQTGHESLMVRLHSWMTKVDIYVSKCASKYASECAVSSLPNTTHFIAPSAGGIGNPDIAMRISRQDEMSAIYIIGVLSPLYKSMAIEISVVLEDTILDLLMGVPVTDHVSQDEYDYFAFNPTSMGTPKVQISLQTLYGDADLYVSTTVTHPDNLTR